MKKLLIILGSIVVLLLAAIILVPVIFKDDIRKALDETMAESLNARVYYDIDRFNLSLIKNFPDMTVSMGDFGIVGADVFEKDTLASVENFLITVDLMSVITGEQIVIEEITLERPKLFVKVLADGRANYDIAKDSGEEELENEDKEETAADGGVQIGINQWSIRNADVSYIDESMGFYITLLGLNHQGSGDFTLDVFDMQTSTNIEKASLGYEGVAYVTDKSLSLDATLNMDLASMKFTFKENRLAVNQFAMKADGYVSMPGEDIEMDITFGGQDIDIKSILSLIPGLYQEYLSGVTAGGSVGFDGFVKGTFNDTTMPAVGASLLVENGKISYDEFNIPIENLNIAANFNYPSADLRETTFNVDKFSMLVDGESVSAYLKFKNLEDYTWDFGFEGNADLEKITKIVPLEGMTLLGKINAKLQSAGKMSLVETEQYEKISTSGSFTIADFLFESADLPQGFSIQRAKMTFNPAEIRLNEFVARAGNSDFDLSGEVTNYLSFAVSDGLLKGKLDFKSRLIDINEWMPQEATEEEEITESDTLEVIRIPENIDFTLNAAIEKIAYSNMPISNFRGKVLIKEGAVILDGNTFEMLGGNFEISGAYITKDLENPRYEMAFKIKDLSIRDAFQTFESVQAYVPIAEQVTGKFSTDFKVEGLLGSDMMPLVDKINLEGLVNVAQAKLEKGAFLQKLSAVAALKSSAGSSSEKSEISVKDVLIRTEIKDGRLYVEPFEIQVNGQKAIVGGSNSLAGMLDYSMQIMDVPTGKLGDALNSALSSFTGGKKLVSDMINLNLGIGGTYDDPKVKLLGTSNPAGGAAPATSLKNELTSKLNAQKSEAEAKAKEELQKQKEAQKEKIMAEAEAKAAAVRKEGKEAAEKIREEGYAAADKLIKDAGSNPIKKKLAEESAKKLRVEADKKAAAVEAEANQKADRIIAEAKAKADKI